MLLFLGAFLSIVILSIAWAFKLGLMAALFIYSYLYLNKHVFLQHKKSIIELDFKGIDDCILSFKDKSFSHACLCKDSYISPFFMCLHFKTKMSMRRQSILFLPNRSNHEKLRKLRYQLNLSKG